MICLCHVSMFVQQLVHGIQMTVSGHFIDEVSRVRISSTAAALSQSTRENLINDIQFMYHHNICLSQDNKRVSVELRPPPLLIAIWVLAYLNDSHSHARKEMTALMTRTRYVC